MAGIDRALAPLDQFLIRLGTISGNRARMICEYLLENQFFQRKRPSDIISSLDTFKLTGDERNTLLGNNASALIERAMKWHSPQNKQFTITIASPFYPEILKNIAFPPICLFVSGNLELLGKPQIAMVGSRHATQSGKLIAEKIAADLCLNEFVITSGLALGIDAASHKGALSVKGHTIGVLGCGIDKIYPARNASLYTDIVANDGALVTEYYPGSPPKAGNFPRRNRIVSGLSLGTVVVEAALKSGSLITARMAVEQNREVFAVPGNPLCAQSEGCHFLIQQGAKLTINFEDILEEFQHLSKMPVRSAVEDCKKSGISSLATDTLLDSVEFDVTHVDIIAERSNLPISEVLAALLEYELRGLVASVPGGYVKLRGK